MQNSGRTKTFIGVILGILGENRYATARFPHTASAEGLGIHIASFHPENTAVQLPSSKTTVDFTNVKEGR